MPEHNLLSRRQLLTRAGAVAAAAVGTTAFAGAGTAARAADSAAPRPTDVLIIGSGYAGAVAAYRLARAGIRSTVIERGLRWPITPQGTTFATPAAPDGRAAWLSTTSPFTPATLNVYPGVLEAFAGSGITALAGAGVGGGSLVNNTVMLQPSAALFKRSFGSSLSYAEMNSVWYPRAASLIGISPMPNDVYDSSFYTAARSWFEETTNAGYQPFRCDLAINWDTVRAEIVGTAVASAIVGQSIWGMNSGAKRSVDNTILAAAEKTGRTTVQTLTRVVDIQPSNGNYLVSCEVIDTSGNVVSRPSYLARHVFLAAGSLGTTRLLVRSRAIGSLPHLPAQIGSGWGNNGDIVGTRIGMPFNNPSDGGPSGIVIEDASNSVQPITLLNFPAHPASGGGWAALGVTFAPPAGTFTYNSATDSVQLTWPASQPSVLVGAQAMTEVLNKLNSANQGTSTAAMSSATTSHCVGGVGLDAIGSDASLHGYPNLRVIDSSLLPGSTGAVPPALTVTALADRLVNRALIPIKASLANA
jgi:cholesterol oxidase